MLLFQYHTDSSILHHKTEILLHNTHTHTHIYIYIYICYVQTSLYRMLVLENPFI